MKKIISAMIVTMLLAIPAVALSKKEKAAKANYRSTTSVRTALAQISMRYGLRMTREKWLKRSLLPHSPRKVELVGMSSQMIQQLEITLQPKSRGFHLVTGEIMRQLPKLPKTGIINSKKTGNNDNRRIKQ